MLECLLCELLCSLLGLSVNTVQTTSSVPSVSVRRHWQSFLLLALLDEDPVCSGNGQGMALSAVELQVRVRSTPILLVLDSALLLFLATSKAFTPYLSFSIVKWEWYWHQPMPQSLIFCPDSLVISERFLFKICFPPSHHVAWLAFCVFWKEI